MKVLLTGGGTAGHINPALAIAEIIRRNAPGSEIAFVGIRGGKEEDLVPREGYPLYYVRSKGIRRSLTPGAILSNIGALWLAATSPYSRATCDIIRNFRPDIVIGTGGYACWPIMAAAARMGIPTALHESNALPGLAVRKLQGHVDRIWINFEGTANRLKNRRNVRRVGNPLRGGFGEIPKEEAKAKLGMAPGERLVLCFGGSLGAEKLNRAVLEMMKTLAPEHPETRFLLAGGKRDYADCCALFRDAGLDGQKNCVLTDYIYDMPLRMSAADLVVSRAGAMTLSELGRMALPAVLVPSPNVTDDHQLINANTVANAGAALVAEEKTFGEGTLTAAVESLLADSERLREMGQAAKRFSDADTDRLIWEDIAARTGGKQQKQDRG